MSKNEGISLVEPCKKIPFEIKDRSYSCRSCKAYNFIIFKESKEIKCVYCNKINDFLTCGKCKIGDNLYLKDQEIRCLKCSEIKKCNPCVKCKTGDNLILQDREEIRCIGCDMNLFTKKQCVCGANSYVLFEDGICLWCKYCKNNNYCP